MIRNLLPLAALTMLFATPAVPCSFHGYMPQETFVERLLGSDHIVLARPGKQEPFRFAEIDVLEGDSEFIEIPELVDITSQQKLAANPEDHILFVRDGAYGPWQRLAYVNEEMDQVLRVVLENLPAWEIGDDAKRFAYFASLLNNPDRDVHTLALKEIDIADYGILRSLDLNVDSQRLMSELDQQNDDGLKPIRLLLLGLSDDPIEPGFFQRGVERNANNTDGILGAYATAMIEHGGPDAVVTLVNNHLKDKTLPSISREMLTEALAIHSSAADAETRETIQRTMDAAIREDPELASMVARHFGARYDWSQSEAISDLMHSGTVKSPIEMLFLTQYVSLAQDNPAQIQN